ncbi:MAG: GNAT family N-acetyltransferase [Calditrichaeota bacterium]|nr:GNAT family N-acetyltransferase [Calditrichota bacterium]MCB9369295.1 GNAT family N-acetyltransferase [Calditrichota bacterium]
MNIRLLTKTDHLDWLRMRCELWPNANKNEQRHEIQIFGNRDSYKVWIAEALDGQVVAFLEGQTCNRADGCLSDRIFFIEGWWVDQKYRRQGVGHALMRAAEEWAKTNGCQELASDTWLDNDPSHAAHLSFGFKEVDRNITYRKELK